MPFPDFDKYKDSFNKKIKDPVIPKQKTNTKDGALTVEEAYSGVEDGSKVKIIDRFTFKNNDNKWSVKYRHLLRDEKAGVDINYIAEGQCVSIEKQLYKNIIKKGPTQKDYNF